MHRLSISDSAGLLSGLQDEKFHSPHVRYLHRLHCVLLVARGNSCYEVARWFEESPRSVERWVHQFEDRHLNGLKEKTKSGRRRKLTCKLLVRLKRDIQQAPSKFGYQQHQWRGRLLKAHLKKHYDIVLGLRQCQRLLRQIRFDGQPD